MGIEKPFDPLPSPPPPLSVSSPQLLHHLSHMRMSAEDAGERRKETFYWHGLTIIVTSVAY